MPPAKSKQLPEQQAIVWVNGDVVFEGPWWKVWRVCLNAVADNRGKPTEITVELEEMEA